VGTDLSPERLTLARAGVYSAWSLRGAPGPVVERYFRREGARYHLVPEIRGAVHFRTLNLAEATYPSVGSGIWEMDLILCRNVLIYFDPATVAAVARRLLDSLSPGGWLFLGASDPPLTELVPCEVVITGAGIAYRRASRGSAAPVPGHAPTRSPEWSRDSVGVHAAQARADDTGRDHASATTLAPQGAEQDQDRVESWVLRVRALANEGRMEEAGRACLSALRLHRTSPELLYLHAVVLLAADRNADAAHAARRALYIDRGLAVAHLLLGDALLRLGSREDAKRALRNAERLLAPLAPAAVVPATDGERAGRLVEVARLKLRLIEKNA
jgi:chemotaxis protein methyltransferase CheR